MMEGHRVKLTEVNPYLVCVLCHGYLVDATTIAECLHSFCRSCIFRQLERKPICPICETQVHNTKLYRSLRPDKTLQDIVYKLVPGLFHNEMQRRRDFYKNHPFRDEHLESECRGVGLDRLIYSPDDLISLSLEFYDDEREKEEWSNQGSPKPAQTAPSGPKRYLQCPAGFKMRHLKKFLRQKYGLSPTFNIDILYKRETLPDSYSLMDVAYVYTWKRNSPMRFYYRMPEIIMKQLMIPPPEVPLIANDDSPSAEPAEPLKEINNKQKYSEKSSEKTENKENVTQNHSEANHTVESKMAKKAVDSVGDKSGETPKVDSGKEDKSKNGAISVSKQDELPVSVLLSLGQSRVEDKADEHKFLVPSVPLKNGLTEKKVNAKISPKFSLNAIATELAESKSLGCPIAPKEPVPSPVQQQQLLHKQKQIQQQKQTYYQKQKQLQIKQQQMNNQKQINQQKQQQLQLKQQQLAQQKQQIQQIIQQQQLQHQLQQQQLQQFHQQQLQQLQNQQQIQSQQPIHILQHPGVQQQQIPVVQQQQIPVVQQQQMPVVQQQQMPVVQQQQMPVVQQQQIPVMQQVLQMQQPQMQSLMQPQVHITATSNGHLQALNQAQDQVQNVVQTELLSTNSQQTKKPQEQIVTSSVNTSQLQQSTPQIQTLQLERTRNSSPLQQTITALSNHNIAPSPQNQATSTPQSHGNQPMSISTPPPPHSTATPPPKVQTPPYTQPKSPIITTKMITSTIPKSPLVTSLQTLPAQNKQENLELKSSVGQQIQSTQYQSNLNLMSGGNVNLTQTNIQPPKSPQLINNSHNIKPWRDIPRTDIPPLNGTPKPKTPQVTLNTSNGSLTIMAQPKNAQNVSTPVNNESSNVLNGKPTETPRPQGIHQNLPRTVLPKSPLVNGKACQKAVPQKNISGQRLNNNLPDMKNGLIQQSNINNRLPTFPKGNARKTLPGAVASKTGPTLDQRIQQLYNAGQANKPTSPGDGAKSESRLASWLNNRFKPPQSPKEETDSTPTTPKSEVSVTKYKRKLQELQKDCEITQENPRPDDPKRRRDVMPDVSIELMRAADMKKLEGAKKEKRPVPGLKSIQDIGGKRKREEDSALDLSSAKPGEGLKPQLPWLVNRPSHFIPRST